MLARANYTKIAGARALRPEYRSTAWVHAHGQDARATSKTAPGARPDLDVGCSMLDVGCSSAAATPRPSRPLRPFRAIAVHPPSSISGVPPLSSAFIGVHLWLIEF